jgi:hypothetical protein
MPAGAQSPAKGLNLRPVHPELRAALRALARAHGLPLYTYVIRLLQAHVVSQWQSHDKSSQHKTLPGLGTKEGS